MNTANGPSLGIGASQKWRSFSKRDPVGTNTHVQETFESFAAASLVSSFTTGAPLL